MSYPEYGLKQSAAQNTAYAQQPKELGIIQRVQGLASGLGEVRERIRVFNERLGFEPPAPPMQPAPAMESGIPAQIMAAEEHLRECINALNRLNDLF
jgi:hypothetical protein